MKYILMICMIVLCIGFVSPLTFLEQKIKEDYIQQGFTDEEAEAIALGKQNMTDLEILHKIDNNETVNEIFEVDEPMSTRQALGLVFIGFVLLALIIFVCFWAYYTITHKDDDALYVKK